MLNNDTRLDAKEIGKRLVELRGSRSQKEVAAAIGISPSAYSMYENGERVPRDGIKMLLAKYYKTTVHKLFFA